MRSFTEFDGPSHQFFKKWLTFGWGDGKVFSVDGTGRNTTGNPETKRLTYQMEKERVSSQKRFMAKTGGTIIQI